MNKEKGFVLVTALILLAILTLLGITSAYKTTTQIKVSKMSADMDRSSAAAKTGLTQIYWYWTLDGDETTGGVKEFNDLVTYLSTGGAAPGVYQGSITPNALSDAPNDAAISANTGMKIFTLSSAGISAPGANAWGFDNFKTPQIAVWITTFDEPAKESDYPYSTAVDLEAGDACGGDCRMVTYSLARSGKSKTLVRETHSVIVRTLEGVSAMTNAPPGADFSEICNPPTTPTVTAGVPAWVAGDTGNGSAVIEATQAPYLSGVLPSGTALASNTRMGSGSKGFRSDITSTTGASFESPPYILYTGHGPAAADNALKVDWATTVSDTVGANLPASKLPKGLVNESLMNTDSELDFFSNPQAQLFDMDVYRWAAEQFTCQYPNRPDGEYGNGLYCSKAEALRVALVAKGYPAVAPVTGRLTIAQIQYNIANGIPMFGFVRLMFPAVPDGGIAVQTCGGVSTRLHVIESDVDNAGYDFNKLVGCDTAGGYDCAYTGSISAPTAGPTGKYAFTIADGAVPDNDGDLGSNARLIVYGMLLIDYFADYSITTAAAGTDSNALLTGIAGNSDTVFNPANGERLLSTLESPDVYLAIEHNMMINPVMPRFNGNPNSFPTAATGVAPGTGTALAAASSMNMVDVSALVASTNKVNLASPFDGYFPWSEGMLGSAGVGNVGTMRLMSRATVADNPGNVGLLSMITDGVSGFGVATKVTSETAVMTSLLGLTKPAGIDAGGVALRTGTEASVLKYYYRLMSENLDQKSDYDWPVAAWPGAGLTSDFCIGKEDCDVGDNMGDKVHLMFPTGYMHGWKVSLAALNMNADEWNTLLSGPGLGLATTVQYSELLNSCSQFGLPGGAGCGAGIPFNMGVDLGALNIGAVADIQNRQTDYFNVTKDTVTGYGLMDYKWLDIPSTMYSGGLLDMHAHSNMNGIIYTPGPLEWEPGNSDYNTGVHLSYVNGSIITGYGAYTKNQSADDRYVMVFDMQAVDNINTNNRQIALRRYNWQRLP